MKKKAVSLILSLCMTFSLFVQFVPLVKAEEISDIPDPWVNPQDYVDGTATFNLDRWVSFACAKNPQEVIFDDVVSEEYQYYFGAEEVSSETLLNVKGYVTANDMLWFEVEAAEGSSIPDILAENPYLLYMATEEDAPALLITAPSSDDGSADDPADDPSQEEPPVDDGVLLPPQLDSEHYTIEEIGQKGYFNQDEVMLYNEPLGTALSVVSVPVSQLDDFIDVVYKVTDNRYSTPTVWYVIRGTDNCDAVKDWQYVYLPALGTDLVLVDNDVTEAYEKLLKADKVDEFEEIAEELGSDIFEKFTEKHTENLNSRYEELVVADTRTYVKNDVIYDGKAVPVSVTGLIPDGLTLSVTAVDDQTIIDEGFDVESKDDIALALDIKLLDENNQEWQPKAGRQITVEMDVSNLGYKDGRIFQLEHKHGEDIYKFDIFIVMDGKLTVRTNGFSMFSVSTSTSTTADNAYNVNNNGAFTMTIGEERYFYADPPGNNPSVGTWQIDDTAGAIYWEVYTNAAAGNQGTYAPWIKIVALKEAVYVNQNNDNRVILDFEYGTYGAYETYRLSIIEPTPDTTKDPDGYKLYLKDDVNKTGQIIATLVDAQGNEIVDDQNNKITLSPETTYSWTRSDNAIIMPEAYGANNASIDIARDHAGLLQSKIDEDGNPTYVTYTVTATLPNGRVKTADYTVYYQSEIINAGFEFPDATSSTYTFFINGQAKLHWKTTGPGDRNQLTRDIEYVDYTGGTNNTNPGFGLSGARDGVQFAELNAENFGTLYQDIISAPGETLEWKFSHAARPTYSNKMYVVIGPTEAAQTLLLQTQLDELAALAKGTQANITALNNGGSVVVEYGGAKYTIWYHDATSTGRWYDISGAYSVPDNQYRTRLFFMSETPSKQNDKNYGNLIDSAVAGQYKSFLVEYYEESFDPDTATRTLTHFKDKDESGIEILYTSVELKNYEYFEKTENDLLSTIYINGKNYPYNIKYKDGKPCLFIEKYEGTPTHYDVTNDDNNNTTYVQNDYSQYDIVMQVFFRDTLIAVQKWVDFPTITDQDGKTKEALSPSQKQNLIDELLNEGDKVGYEAKFRLDCTSTELHTDENKLEGHFAEKAIHITQNDPYGWYTGYIPFGDNPGFEHKFTLEETNVSQLTGLELESVKFIYYKFKDGKRITEDTVTHNAGENVKYSIDGIKISDNDDGSRLAEIEVRNKYREKEIIINYEAVGRGGVDVQGNSDTTFKDKDWEVLNYYSEISNGVKVKPEGKYVFAGWFLDKECTIPVDENHGYVDAQGGFIPNKSKTFSDEVLEVTYYAKFDIGSLQIIRENAEPGEVFVYKVENTLTGSNNVVMYVTVTIGEDGKGSTNIMNVPFAPDNQNPYTYTVTEMKDWSWRYPKESITKEHIRSEGLHGATNMMTTFTFDGNVVNGSWLNGIDAAVNKRRIS